MNYDIVYVTEYRYGGPVVDNINAVRAKPATSESQRPSGFRLTVSPDVRIHQHTDYFGTTVHQFEVTKPHTHLTITVATRCVTSPQPPPPDPTWDAVRTVDYREVGAEFLVPHEAARSHAVLDKLRADSQSDTPLATVRALCDLIPTTFEYRTGVTYVGSTVAHGDFALQAIEGGYLTARQIEAGRMAIQRKVARLGKLFIRVFPDKPFTKKPLETRMGHGKGAPEYYVAVVKPGRILYEIDGIDEATARWR